MISVSFLLPSATRMFYPENKDMQVTGGAEINLYNITTKMAEDPNYDLSFIVSDYGQKNIVHKGVKIIKIKYLDLRKGKFIALRRQVNLILHELRIPSDVVVTTAASEHLGLLVLLHQTLRRKKVIFRLAHDYNYDLKRYKKLYGKRFYYLYKYGLYNASHIVTQTEHQKKALDKIGIKSTVIKNGFYLNEEESKSKNYILWVARSAKMKRPELFMDLVEQLPNHKFIMIMPMNEDNESINIKKDIVIRANKCNNLEFIDYVKPQEIQTYYNNAKAFVNTSSAEGFPNTFIQSGLGKTPIISLAINPDEMFDKYDIGCYCDDDLMKAVNFINSLDSEKVQYYGENIHQYVEENHSIEVVSKQYKKVIEGVL